LNKWEEIKLNFPLPNDFYRASMIKVYVFNPTDKVLFIDDVTVAFKKDRAKY
jgi:hypothetical protein